MSQKPTYGELKERIKKLKEENDLYRKQTKKWIEGEKYYFGDLLDLSPDPIVILHEDKHRFVNTKFTKVFGYSKDDFSQKGSFFKLIQDKDKKTISQLYEKRLKGRRPSQFYRIDLIAKDGRVIPCETSARLLTIVGQPIVLVIIRDVTERNTHEKFLEESSQRLSIALQSSNTGIWDWNLQTDEVFFGENYFKMAGYEPDEFDHNYENWKARVHPDDIEETEKIIKSYINCASEGYKTEFRFKTKSNNWMWILDQGKIFEYDNDGRPVRFTGTHHDITDRKHYENALKESYETLEKKVKERTSELCDLNTALKVLLKSRENDKDDIEEKIFANFKLRISPTIDRLKKNLIKKPQQTMINQLESELKDITSPFSKKLSDPMIKLTPMEIQISSMIKLGKSNKEISNDLDRSASTIANHRESIRKKLNIRNTKINLRTFLSSL